MMSPKLVANKDGSILLSQFHPEYYPGFLDSPYLEKDAKSWKHFFDFYVDKAQESMLKRITAATAA